MKRNATYETIQEDQRDIRIQFYFSEWVTFLKLLKMMVTASKVLGIHYQTFNRAASEVPLAGFPHHALDNYLPKLVKAGYRVAVCEQLKYPKYAKGIVKRCRGRSPGSNFSEKTSRS
ncbi:MAG: hypothetical protein R3A12_17565 [Ignavibacteria bacterium]